jgi:hypothetical protein
VNRVMSVMLERVDFLEKQRSILEQVFEEGWFRDADKKARQHPAYMRWKLCRELIHQGGDISGLQLYQLGRIALDTYYFLQLTESDIERLELGSFDSVGDPGVRKHIQNRVKDPDFYEDLMVQIYVAAWHKANKHSVMLIEKENESWPDLRVDMEIPNIPLLIECKHLRNTSSDPAANLEKTIRRLVNKANNQLKKGKESLGHGHCYGVLVLDVSSALSIEDGETEGFPNKVLEISSIVQRALSGDKNTSVQTAIIVWDTYKLELEGQLAFHCICSRHCLRVSHTMPALVFPDNTPPSILAMFENFTQGYLLSDYEFHITAMQEANR